MVPARGRARQRRDADELNGYRLANQARRLLQRILDLERQVGEGMPLRFVSRDATAPGESPGKVAQGGAEAGCLAIVEVRESPRGAG